ncbi:MAG: ABC transporter ATP-binding protein [Bdellovibrionales bacterium]|nr:ABC transporter ATP-binding protein [Bdellovibrionales bacterium]
MAVLKIENLVKTYDSFRAVNQVSFEVRSGEIFGLLGPNGAGKTSIISTIITLEKPTKGSISIADRDIVQQERATKAITGVVPQEVVTHGYFNVEEILGFHSGYYGLMNNKKRIHELMKQLDLWVHRHKKVRQLSGGMKRRLMIAKALVHSPRLLLLDEPTAGVDVELRHSIWEQVRKLKKEGVAILFTTHYLEEAEQLCDRVAIIHEGQIKKQGTTQELVQKLTSRHLTITLRNKMECVHPSLVNYQDNTLEFRVPYSIEIGKFLSDLNFPSDNILDMKIREGTLEEAFKYVLDKI